MKKFGLLCVLLSVFISGCGKKDSDSSKQKSSKKTSEKLVQAKSAGSVVHETEEFFDKSKVADFAFIDDEKFEDELEISKEAVEIAEGEKGFADETFEFIEDEKLASADMDDTGELDRLTKDAAVTTAALDDLVEAVDELQQEMMRDTIDDEEEAERVVFKNVCFDINKNDIRADQKAIVDEDIKLTKKAIEEGGEVIVKGHCCQLGRDAYNVVLSQRRAETIKKEMVKHGIDADRIKTLGCGNETPIVWSDAKEKRQLVEELAPNRRAEIIVN